MVVGVAALGDPEEGAGVEPSGRGRVLAVTGLQVGIPGDREVEMGRGSLGVPGGADEADDLAALDTNARLDPFGELVEVGQVVATPVVAPEPDEVAADRLATRNLLDQLRSTGLETGGPPSPGRGEQQAFANGLDRWLTRHCR